MPMGTTPEAGYFGGLGYREKIAGILRSMWTKRFPTYRHGDWVQICADVDGNECVWIRGKVPPPPLAIDNSSDRNPQLRLPERGLDFIDI